MPKSQREEGTIIIVVNKGKYIHTSKEVGKYGHRVKIFKKSPIFFHTSLRLLSPNKSLFH